MKKAWIIVLVVAIVALIAIIAYSPQSNVSDTNKAPNTASGSGNVAMPGSQTDDDEEDEREEDEFEEEDNNTPTGSATLNNTSNTNTVISLSELSNHDTKNDCWIAYKNSVYDITQFLPVHPGSSAAIEPYCGTSGEFEKAFTGKHGTSQVSNLQKRGTFKGNLA